MQEQAHLLAVRRMVPIEVGDTHEKGYDVSNQDGFVMYTQKVETLEPWLSSHVIPQYVKTMEAYLGERA